MQSALLHPNNYFKKKMFLYITIKTKTNITFINNLKLTYYKKYK